MTRDKVVIMTCLLCNRGKEKSSGLSDWNGSYTMLGGNNVTKCASDD